MIKSLSIKFNKEGKDQFLKFDSELAGDTLAKAIIETLKGSSINQIYIPISSISNGRTTYLGTSKAFQKMCSESTITILNNEGEIKMEESKNATVNGTEDVKRTVEDWMKIGGPELKKFMNEGFTQDKERFAKMLNSNNHESIAMMIEGMKKVAMRLKTRGFSDKAAEMEEGATKVEGIAEEAKLKSLMDMLVSMFKLLFKKFMALCKGAIWFALDTTFIIGGGLLDMVIRIVDAGYRDVIQGVAKA